jgi:hypothetical protein
MHYSTRAVPDIDSENARYQGTIEAEAQEVFFGANQGSSVVGFYTAKAAGSQDSTHLEKERDRGQDDQQGKTSSINTSFTPELVGKQSEVNSTCEWAVPDMDSESTLMPSPLEPQDAVPRCDQPASLQSHASHRTRLSRISHTHKERKRNKEQDQLQGATGDIKISSAPELVGNYLAVEFGFEGHG